MRLLPGHERRAPADAEPVLRRSAELAQRDRILRATGELVARRGYRGTTVERIVKSAHVAYPTFYKHFETKEDAFVALLQASGQEAWRRMSQAFEDAGDEWPEQVAAALRSLFALIASEPLIARACLVESLNASPRAVATYERGIGKVAPMLRAGRDHSPAGAELPARLEDTVTAAIVWMLYQRLVVNALEELEQLLPEALELALRSYLGEKEVARISSRMRAM